jgi:hypothetical protein
MKKQWLFALVALAVLVDFPSLAAAGPPGNTKKGKHALQGNTGSNNTAVGFQAMDPNALCTGGGTPNPCCTGVGTGTCGNSGLRNTAVGANSLSSNTTGHGNNAVGEGALLSNTTGDDNNAVGWGALSSNTTGRFNVAVGQCALCSNTTGNHNIALGLSTLSNNTTGSENIAMGTSALQDNTTGGDNTALGELALLSNTTGNSNIAVGSSAGQNLTTGSNNIDIGNDGVGAEENTIRIGVPGTQTATFIAGISDGVGNGTGVAVYVDSTGQLSPIVSSARFKDDIRDMGESTSGLMKLRPVRFRYKKEINSSGLEQYGLVAEEVAKVYPDLVVYDDKGRPQTVRYHFVNAMLLNEVQKQARQITAQRQQLSEQGRQIETLTSQARQVNAQTQQIEALTGRLVQLEATVSAQGHAPAVEASYRNASGL